MHRRRFLCASPLLLFGERLACARSLQSQTGPKGPDLKEDLSAAETETVNNSVMAKDVDNFYGKGYS